MDDDLSNLTLDQQFAFLLHKKIMHKSHQGKRQSTYYYKKQYKKTGLIPKPLLLAGQGILDGRKCSGRTRAISDVIVKRFTEMVRASSDETDHGFIFITKKTRKIKNFHVWLEQEFGPISLDALYRVAKRENLARYLLQEDFTTTGKIPTYFNPVNTFELIQVDGCQFQTFKIKDQQGQWRKPIVIEFYDTNSRYMFCMDVYFSENSQNSVRQFSSFLLSSPFVAKKIRIRPDNSKAFLNLKRPIKQINQIYSNSGDGFFMQTDYSGVRAPKHKVHLETSHRALHNFEARIIKYFEDKIVGTQPSVMFQENKKTKLTITHLDVSIEQLRNAPIIARYIKEHNEKKHAFSHQGCTQGWIPKQVFNDFLAQNKTFKFKPEDVENLMAYGFDKVKASVSKMGIITYKKHQYCVVIGREKFSSHRSTQVKISCYQNKLFIFEDKQDGILLAEAQKKAPSKCPGVKKEDTLITLENGFDQLSSYLNQQGMTVNTQALITKYQQGLTLEKAKDIMQKNHGRYEQYRKKTHCPLEQIKKALFNAFLIDYDRFSHQKIPPYAKEKEHP